MLTQIPRRTMMLVGVPVRTVEEPVSGCAPNGKGPALSKTGDSEFDSRQQGIIDYTLAERRLMKVLWKLDPAMVAMIEGLREK